LARMMADERKALFSRRRRHIAQFLSCAAGRETTYSLRLANRPDIARVRRVIDGFDEPWWAATVYTCFDSEIGTADD
jgi:hypothetical protein